MEYGSSSQYKKMTEKPVAKTLLTLSIPTVISMLITTVYNMTDTFFVSSLGSEACAAVGILFPAAALLQAVGFTLGTGAGSMISRMLGKKDTENAGVAATAALTVSVLFGIAAALLGVIFRVPLMRFFGARDNVALLAGVYALPVFLSAPQASASFVLNNILRGEGRTFLAMSGLAVGGITNIILDPLLINAAGLGIAGAAWATFIGQTVGLAVLLIPFISKKTASRLKPKQVFSSLKDISAIIKNGSPSFFRQGFAAVSAGLLNRAASDFGADAVSAVSVSGKLFMMAFGIVLGFGQGYQPLVGYNFTAGKKERILSAGRWMLVYSQTAAVLTGAVGFFLSKNLIAVFLDEPTVINIGSAMLRFGAAGLLFVPPGILVNMAYQAIGKPFISSLLASLRQGIFFIPLILLLPKLWGIIGIEAAQSISDALNFAAAIPFLIKFNSIIKNSGTQTRTG